MALCRSPIPKRRAGEGAIAVGAVAVSRGEAGPDRDVAAVRADEVEQPDELVDRMLAVGVHATAVGVAALVRLAVARRDPCP